LCRGLWNPWFLLVRLRTILFGHYKVGYRSLEFVVFWTSSNIRCRLSPLDRPTCSSQQNPWWSPLWSWDHLFWIDCFKLSSMNVMADILLCIWVVAEFITCTLLKCFFHAKAEEPSYANPPAIVLITPRTRFLWRPSLSLHRFGNLERFLLDDLSATLSSWSSSRASSWPSSWRVSCFPLHKSPQVSLILSFSMIHSSIFCP